MDDATVVTLLPNLAQGLIIDRYVNTAGATAWIYDFLLTLPQEYQYIWKRKWSSIKVLYLVVRARLL